MSKLESGLWGEMKRALGNRDLHDLRRIENACEEGTPDVDYCIDGACGWVELKRIQELPRRPTTVVKVDHFTGGQRGWLLRRATCGGACFVLLRAGDETFLFQGGLAARYLGLQWTVEQCRTRALYHAVGRPDWTRIAEHLRGVL